MNKQPLRIAVLGGGTRGLILSQIVQDFAHLGKIVGVAEPRASYREQFAQRHHLSPDMVFDSWQAFTEQKRACDAVIITTMDRDHVGPALACMDHGYHILMEKPIAPTLEECRQLEQAQRTSGVIAAVCHSLRYQKGFAKLKEMVDEGRVGRVITIDAIEQVAWWHQAHSYVRGNWHNEGQSAFMLLAKSCHDIDYLTYLIDQPCQSVASFGDLTYFRSENAPSGAGERCTQCVLEPNCIFSAVKFYLQTDRERFPAAVISPDHSFQSHLEALRTGPYGRCVWKSDNDVVDHQVVLMQYGQGITITFTMTAFTQELGRRIRVHGTTGEIYFDQKTITVKTFGDNNVEVLTIGAEQGDHGGGDRRVIHNWLLALQRSDPKFVLTSLQESLKTHTIVFAAEQARRENRMVHMSEYDGQVAAPARCETAAASNAR